MNAKKLKKEGVRGWLLVLVLYLFASPIPGFVASYYKMDFKESIYPGLSDELGWQLAIYGGYIILIAAATMKIVAGVRLAMKGGPEVVKFAIIALWLAGPSARLADLIWVAIVSRGGIPVDAVAAQFWGVLFSAAVAAAWTLYLVKSVRVKNTFYTPAATDEHTSEPLSPG